MKYRPLLSNPWVAAAFSAAICAAAWSEREKLTPQMKFCLTLVLLVNVPYVVDGIRKRRK